MEKAGHPLAKIPDFPTVFARKLADLNITTAEEFVSLISISDHQAKRVAEFLGAGEDQLRQLIALANHCMPDAIRKQMEQRPDTSQYGLGALPPKAPKVNPKA